MDAFWRGVAPWVSWVALGSQDAAILRTWGTAMLCPYKSVSDASGIIAEDFCSKLLIIMGILWLWSVSYWNWGHSWRSVLAYFLLGTGGPLGLEVAGRILDLSKGVCVPAGS